MASEVRNFAPQIPAGTAIAAPVTISLAMPPRIVTKIRWRVPEGAFGQMGFRVAMSGVSIIPWNAGQWIIANDEWDEITLDNYPTSGAWQLIGYNLGIYPHTVYLKFELQTVSVAASAPALAPLHIASTPADVVAVAVTTTPAVTATATAPVPTASPVAPAAPPSTPVSPAH